MKINRSSGFLIFNETPQQSLANTHSSMAGMNRNQEKFGFVEDAPGQAESGSLSLMAGKHQGNPGHRQDSSALRAGPSFTEARFERGVHDRHDVV